MTPRGAGTCFGPVCAIRECWVQQAWGKGPGDVRLNRKATGLYWQGCDGTLKRGQTSVSDSKTEVKPPECYNLKNLSLSSAFPFLRPQIPSLFRGCPERQHQEGCAGLPAPSISGWGSGSTGKAGTAGWGGGREHWG